MRAFLIATALGALFAATAASAASHRSAPRRGSAPAADLTISRIPLPGEGRGDYLLADPVGNRLYVTHSKVVHILDLTTLAPVGTVEGLSAAHGVALDGAGHAFVSDGDNNRVVEVDAATGKSIAIIPVGKKPDSILFDATSSTIMAFDGNSDEISVIDPARGSVVKTIKLPQAPEFSQSDGHGRVYVNLEEGNAIAVVDTSKMVLDHLIALPGCDGPAPLALDRVGRRLFAGCGNNVMVVADADSGKVVASVPIGGDPDGIVFDPATRRIFVANRDGSWTIAIQQTPNRYRVERSLKIDQYAKTVALDPATHRVFSSTADLVWPPKVAGKKYLPNAKPGSFRLLVVAQH